MIESNQLKFNFPYRIGKKQKRAVLDKDGVEIVVFPKGKEFLATFFINQLNKIMEKDNIVLKEEIDRLIKDYLKNNLKLSIEDETSQSEVHYSKDTYIRLYLGDELISSQRIDGLHEDR